MIHVLVTMEIKAGGMEEFLRLCGKLRPLVLAEKRLPGLRLHPRHRLAPLHPGAPGRESRDPRREMGVPRCSQDPYGDRPHEGLRSRDERPARERRRPRLRICILMGY